MKKEEETNGREKRKERLRNGVNILRERKYKIEEIDTRSGIRKES